MRSSFILLLFAYISLPAQDDMRYEFDALRSSIDSLIQVQQLDLVPELLEKLDLVVQKMNADSSWVESHKYHAKYYYYASDFERSTSHMIEAAKGYLRLNDSLMASKMYNNLSGLISSTGDVDRALEYKLLALQLCPPELDARWHITLLNNTANTFIEQGELAQALELLQKAKKEARKIDYKPGIGASNHLLSIYEFSKGNYERALSYCDTVQTQYKLEIPNEMFENSVFTKARAHFELGQIDEALKATYESITLIKDGGLTINLASSYDLLSSIYASKRQYDSAYSVNKKASILRDSLFNLEKQEAILELERKFNTEKKEVEIENLTQRNQIQDLQLDRQKLWLLLSVIGIVGLVSVIFLVYFLYQKRLADKAKESEDLRQKLLRIQLNPHFTYNSLNAIQSMIYEGNDRQKTADYLSSFSSLMRNILELNQHDYIALEEELDFIENYVDIQQIRFDQPLTFHLTIDKDLKIDRLLLPPMITQPFLENAFEHGFPDKSKGGDLWLQMSEENDLLVISIKDNGVGRKASAKEQKDHVSLATKITHERLSTLSQRFAREFSLSIHDLTDDGKANGTEVTIKLPLLYD